MAAPIVPRPVHVAIALGRRETGNCSSTRLSDDGVAIDAPTAWPRRAATNTHAAGASASAVDATQNTATPVTKMRRLPTRSASRPPSSINDASAIEYPVMPHDSVVRLAPSNSASISGNTTLTAVTAMPTTIDVADASVRPHQARVSTGSRTGRATTDMVGRRYRTGRTAPQFGPGHGG